MSNFHDEIRDIKRNMSATSSNLRHLSAGFEIVGNYSVANSLLEEAIEINDLVVRLEKAVSDRLTQDVKIAQQSSINVLNAALAGVELGRREKGNSGE